MTEDIKTNQERTNTSNIPYNELHLQFMTTEPAWGKESTSDLYDGLSTTLKKIRKDETGKFYITDEDKRNLWGYLAFFTRDLRLGNLSVTMGEVDYCRYYLEFAGNCLHFNLIKSFITALQKVISTIEISQSKGGFLRRRGGGGTITREDITPQQQNTGLKGVFGGKQEEK